MPAADRTAAGTAIESVWQFRLTGNLPAEAAVAAPEADTSLLNTIINIVPDNLLSPFVRSDTLQLIFLAMLIGFAAGTIGKYSVRVKDILEALNSLFLTVTTMITRLIPLAVFCAISMMMLQLDSGSILSVIGAGGTTILTDFLMMSCYALLLLCPRRLILLSFIFQMPGADHCPPPHKWFRSA